jgi:hypothetical protein
VALIVSLVVAVGETVVLPFALTVPTVGEMLTVLAPVVLQLNVACPPAAMVLGLAAKRTICAVVGALTVTVTTEVTVLPSPPVALIV